MSSVSAAWIGVASAIVIGGVMTGSLLTQRGGTVSNASPAAATVPAQGDLGPARLTRKLGPFEIVSATDTAFIERGIRIGPRRVVINYGATEDGELRRAFLEITKTERQDNSGVLLTTRVERITPIDDTWSRYGVGRVIPILAVFDDVGRLVLTPQPSRNGETVQIGRNEPKWFGVRPPMGWEEHGQIPDDAGEFGLLGPWTEAERIPVTMDGREIVFGAETWTAARYRIIEWERREGYSRVLSVYAGGRDPRKIGTRFRLLIRFDENDGYSIAYFPPGSEAGDAWPSSFEFDQNNPVRVVEFGGGR